MSWFARAARQVVTSLSLGCLITTGAFAAGADEPSTQLPEASAWYDATALYTILYQQEQLPKAAEVAQQAVEIAERVFGATDGRLAQSLNDLGAIYQQQDQLEQAAACHERSLRIRRVAQPPDPAAMAQSLSNLARVYYAQQRLVDAKPLLQESLGIIERHAGATHAQTVTPLHYLALIAMQNGDQDDADTFFLRAIAVLEAFRAQKPPVLGEILRDYAAFLRASGRAQEAEAVEASRAPLDSPPEDSGVRQ